MSASWPTSVATDSTLYVAVNELQNNLSGAINNSVTTIGLNSTTGFPSVGLVLIDNEVIKYGGISGNNLTSCTRAFDGTTAASHSSAAVVSFAFCAAHHNGLKDEIIAIETSLNLTASKAIATNASGRLVAATTTDTELGYLAGVTSAIQTQLNLKAPLASPTFTGTITTPLTANRAVATGASGVLAISATTDTELGYVSGVTSAIQTQLTGKVGTTGNETIAGNKTFSGTTDVTGQLKGKGTATNDAAAAGYIGEQITSAVTTGGFPATTVWGDVISIPLTAGDWDVYAQMVCDNSGGTWSRVDLGISTTSGNSSTGLVLGQNFVSEGWANSSTTPTIKALGIAGFRVSLSGTTTYYLKFRCTYSAGTPANDGALIYARRVR